MTLTLQVVSSTFLVLSALRAARADVYVMDRTMQATVAEYRSATSGFGKAFPEDGLRGRAVRADPLHGCGRIKPPPDLPVFEPDPSSETWIAVISRYGGCNFEEKVRNAMMANYSSAIVFNVNSNALIPMAGIDDSLIPSVFLGYDDAQVLLSKYTYDKSPRLRIILTGDSPFNMNSYLLPFAIVVGVCFVIMLVIVVYKCVQDYRRQRRHRLPKSALKKLPVHKYKSGDPFDTCCICLEDFEEGDKLRILPCDHGYHSKCIDPWLVKTKRICPQCRKRVFETNEFGAGLISVPSDSDSDNNAAAGREEAEQREREDERDPILPEPVYTTRFTHRQRRHFRRQRRAAGGGTFSSSPSSRQQQRQHSRLSTQERIRRAFGRRGQQSLFQHQPGVVSSEEHDAASSSSDEWPTFVTPPPIPRGEATFSSSLQRQVRRSDDSLQQRAGGGSTSSSANVFVADVHAIPITNEIEPQPGPSRRRDGLSESDFVEMPEDDVRPNRKPRRRGSDLEQLSNSSVENV